MVIEDNLIELLHASLYARFLAKDKALKHINDKGITLKELREITVPEIEKVAKTLGYGIMDTTRFMRIVSVSVDGGSATKTPAPKRANGKKRGGSSSTAGGSLRGGGLSLAEARKLRKSVAKAHGQENTPIAALGVGAVVIEVKNVARNLVDVYLGSRAAIDEEYGLTSAVASESITLKMSDSASVAFHKAVAAFRRADEAQEGQEGQGRDGEGEDRRAPRHISVRGRDRGEGGRRMA